MATLTNPIRDIIAKEINLRTLSKLLLQDIEKFQYAAHQDASAHEALEELVQFYLEDAIQIGFNYGKHEVQQKQGEARTEGSPSSYTKLLSRIATR